VSRIENRIAEAQKLGFEEIYISSYFKKGEALSKYSIQIKTFSKLNAVVNSLF
jgi:DNA repair protein RadA/Sms